MVSAAYCTLLLFPPSKHGFLVAYRHMCGATVVKVGCLLILIVCKPGPLWLIT